MSFNMPKNHLALSNIYLNFAEIVKAHFTPDNLATLLNSDLEIEQKQKLLVKILKKLKNL